LLFLTLLSGKCQRENWGCGVKSGETERALSAGELGTEVRHGDGSRERAADGEHSLPGTKGC